MFALTPLLVLLASVFAKNNSSTHPGNKDGNSTATGNSTSAGSGGTTGPATGDGSSVGPHPGPQGWSLTTPGDWYYIVCDGMDIDYAKLEYATYTRGDSQNAPCTFWPSTSGQNYIKKFVAGAKPVGQGSLSLTVDHGGEKMDVKVGCFIDVGNDKLNQGSYVTMMTCNAEAQFKLQSNNTWGKCTYRSS